MADLANSTIDTLDKTFVNQIVKQNAMFAMFYAERRIDTKGGLKKAYDVGIATGQSSVQMYGENDILEVSQNEVTGKAKFDWKLGQCPVRVGVKEWLLNKQGASAVVTRDLVKLLVESAHAGIKEEFDEMFHATDSSDSGKNFQSVPDSLEHARTYGEITSTTAAKTWWNGASLANSWTDRATEWALSLANISKMQLKCNRYAKNLTDKQYLFLPDRLWVRAQSLAEGKAAYQVSSEKNSKLFSFGHKTYIIHGVEVVQDSYMENNSQTSYALLVTPSTFDLVFHPDRVFTMPDGFVHQSRIAGQKDEYVGRLYFMGNLLNKQPNRGMWKSNTV